MPVLSADLHCCASPGSPANPAVVLCKRYKPCQQTQQTPGAAVTSCCGLGNNKDWTFKNEENFEWLRQALIACRRYQDAMKAVCRLAAGADKLYLQAEVLWRQSDLTCAAEILAGACQQSSGSSKCRELQLWVQSLQDRTHKADVACKGGELALCPMQYSRPLLL